jgi:hypothetical protein
VAGSPPPEAAYHRAAIAGLTKNGVPKDDPRYAEHRRALDAALLADHIRKVVDRAPPLTAEQRTKLAELLKPVRKKLAEQKLAQHNNGGRDAAP